MDNIAHIKKQLIIALEKSLGVVTTACKQVDVSRSTFYNYLRNDPEFKKAVDDIENISLDFAESQLHKQIKDGSTTATIFYLKTKGKHRGYVERTENINRNYEVDADPLKEFREALKGDTNKETETGS